MLAANPGESSSDLSGFQWFEGKKKKKQHVFESLDVDIFIPQAHLFSNSSTADFNCMFMLNYICNVHRVDPTMSVCGIHMGNPDCKNVPAYVQSSIGHYKTLAK